MIALYLRLQGRLLYNRLFKSGKKDLGIFLLILFVVLANLPMAILTVGALKTGFEQVASQHGLEVLQRLLYPQAGFVGVFLLFSALKAIHPSLFEAPDLDFLRALPVRPWRLYAAKFALLFVPLSLTLLFFLPAAIFFGRAADTSWTYYLSLPFFFLPYALLIIAFATLLTLVLARMVPAQSLSRLAKYGPLVGLVPIFLAVFFFFPRLQSQISELSNLIEKGLVFANYFDRGPPAWFADALVAAATGQLGQALLHLLLITGGALVLLSLSVRLGQPIFSGEPPAEEAPPTQSRPHSQQRTALPWAPALFGSTVQALWSLESIALRREFVRTVLPLLGFSLFLIFFGQYLGDFFPVLPLLGFYALSMGNSLCTPAVGQEGKAFWLVRSLPVPLWKILLVKLAVRTSLSALVLVVLSLAAGFFVPQARSLFSQDPLLASGGALGLILVMLLCGAWSLAIGARFPRFEPSAKGNHINLSAGLCSIMGSFLIAGTIALACLPYFVDALRPLLWFLPAVVYLFWLGICIVLGVWALWYLERLEA